MNGPFKMKGYSYPGTSPIRDDQYDINGVGIDHAHDSDTDTDTATFDPLTDVNSDGTPKTDFSVSWGNQSGFGIGVGAEGWKKFAAWGADKWKSSSTLGKIGIGAAHLAVGGLALANPKAAGNVIKSIGKLFK